MTVAERRLRSFLNMKEDAPLSPITHQLIMKYLDVSAEEAKQMGLTIPRNLYEAGNRGFMDKAISDRIAPILEKQKDIGEILRDQIFLFAAGSQLAYDLMSPKERTILDKSNVGAAYEHSVLRGRMDQGAEFLYICTPPEDTSTPNAAIITLGGAIGYAALHVQESQRGATKDQKELYIEQVRLALNAGAEETFHALQHHDPAKRAELEALSRKRYGPNHEEERARQLLASRTTPESIKAFSDNDPYEMDAEKSMAKIKYRDYALTSKFLAPEITIGKK